MKSTFKYSITNSLKGVFYSFSENLWDNIEAEVSSNYSDEYTMVNVFDFTTDKYWISKVNGENGTLVFCFKHHYFLPQGFELGTSGRDALASVFLFSSSNDKNHWSNEILYQYRYGPNDIFYFSYESPPKQCFKLTCIENILGEKTRFDLRYLEVFGEIQSKLSMFKRHISCSIKNHPRYFLFFSFFCTNH